MKYVNIPTLSGERGVASCDTGTAIVILTIVALHQQQDFYSGMFFYSTVGLSVKAYFLYIYSEKSVSNCGQKSLALSFLWFLVFLALLSSHLQKTRHYFESVRDRVLTNLQGAHLGFFIAASGWRVGVGRGLTLKLYIIYLILKIIL